MKRHYLALAIGLCTCSQAAQPATASTTQSKIRDDISGIVEYVNLSGMHVVVQDREAYLRVLKQKAQDRAANTIKKDSDYENTTYKMLSVPSQATRITAREISYSWKKFQDRARFAVTTNVNGGLLNLPSVIPIPTPAYNNYSTQCFLPFVGNLEAQLKRSIYGVKPLQEGTLTDLKSGNPVAPEGDISSWDGKFLTPGYQLPKKLQWKAIPDRVDLARINGDPLTMLHQIPLTGSGTWCPSSAPSLLSDDLLDLPIPRQVYKPALMNCNPVGCFSTGGFPMPRSIAWGEIKRRQEEACGQIKNYAADYYKEVAAAIAKVPGGIVWSGRTDDYIGLYNVGTNRVPTSVDEAKVVKDQLEKVITDSELPDANPLVSDYYNVGTVLTNLGFKGGGNKFEGETGKIDEVGVTKLEELKRLFPALDIRSQEIVGVASIFQTWAKPEAILDSKIQTFNFKSKCSAVWAVCPPSPNVTLPVHDMVITPATCTVLPTRLGTVTYTMPRYHFRWVNVPEGYAIPDVNGTPVGMSEGRS